MLSQEGRDYNVEKCEVMHFGKRNGGIDYFLNGKCLGNQKYGGTWESLFKILLRLTCRFCWQLGRQMQC